MPNLQLEKVHFACIVHIPYEICLSNDMNSNILLPLALCRQILLSRADTCAFEGSNVAAHRVHEWAHAACVKDDYSAHRSADS